MNQSVDAAYLPKMTVGMRRFLTSARRPASCQTCLDLMELRDSGLTVNHVQYHERGKNGEFHPCFAPGKLSLESFPGNFSLESFP